MNDAFQKKVSAASVAGWWTILIAAGFLMIQWVVYLFITSARPAWFLSLLGTDIGWPAFQNLWFWIAAIFKLCVWLLILIVVWLTLWARQLRMQADRS